MGDVSKGNVSFCLDLGPNPDSLFFLGLNMVTN